MRAYDFHEGRLLEGFAGPAEEILPEYAVRGLRVRVTPGWWAHARCLCTDTEAWFPEPLTRAVPQAARICAVCPVRKSCLASAILDDEHGIWGGTRRGQRLHARARLVNDERPAEVIADLLAAPIPGTEYGVPDPHPHPDPDPDPDPDPVLDPVPDPVVSPVAQVEDLPAWREAS